MDQNCMKCKSLKEMKKAKMTEGKIQEFCYEECSIGRTVNQLGDLLLDKEWSEDELFYLVNNLDVRPIKNIARKLQKPVEEVRLKAKLYKNNLLTKV